VASILLVQPRFPIPSKSLNHKDYLPVGLLKLATWHRQSGNSVALSLGDLRLDCDPQEILVTSLFTYWADHVRRSVQECRAVYPKARIAVGGIYASLQPEHCKAFTGCDDVFVGLHEAETCVPDYSLVETDFQIVHASRGCVRSCKFCGTHIIEPRFVPKSSVKSEIVKNHIVFYDNNFLANPYVEILLREIAELRLHGRVVTCESQSGFDGRILLRHPDYARLLKAAHFRNPRIAWDSGLKDAGRVEDQVSILVEAGFQRKEIQVFMLYNHDLSPEELMKKVERCFQLGVQVSDCRFRPLDRFSDGYNPRAASQGHNDYYVHAGWTDQAIRTLRRTVRSNNICVRYAIPRDRYDQRLEGLSRERRKAVMAALGMASGALSKTELDALNAAWLERPVEPGGTRPLSPPSLRLFPVEE
jgi:hypothetical protein